MSRATNWVTNRVTWPRTRMDGGGLFLQVKHAFGPGRRSATFVHTEAVRGANSGG